MSEQESLRLAAELVDNFSPTMRKLRSSLQDIQKAGEQHTAAIAQGFGKAESALASVGKTASTVVNPAFAALGITSLTLGATIAGIGASLRSFATSTAALGQLSRETNISAQALATFGAVAGKFNITQDQVAQGAQTFADKMRMFSRRSGDLWNWTMHQGRDPAGRKAFQDFAEDLARTSDEGERLRKTLQFSETIKDPADRRIFTQQYLGSADFARLGDKHAGTFAENWKKGLDKVGKIEARDLVDAEKFELAIADMRTSMSKLGRTIGRELLGPASDFTHWLDSLVSGQRGDVTKSLRDGLAAVREELGKIDWPQAAKDAETFLKSTTALAGTLAGALHSVAQAIHAMNEGKPLEAFRHLDGGSGPLARRLAPLPGDDKIERAEGIEALKGKIGTAQEQGGLQADLLKELEERGDRDGAKRLREAMEANSRNLKALQEELRKLTDQGGATAQKSAFGDDGGAGLGGLIHRAGYTFPGSVTAAGRIVRGYGGSGPGYGGERGPAGSAGRSYGGGRFNGLGGGSPVPHVPEYGPDHPVNRVGRIARGEPEHAGGGFGGQGAARTGDMMRYAMDQLRKEGVPEDHLRTAAAHLVGQAQMESGLNPNRTHDPDASGRPTGYGIYGARLVRRDRMLSWLAENGYARNSPEGQMRYMAREAMNDPKYRATRRILMGQGSGNLERDTNDITGNFEAPKFINRRSGAVANALRTGPSAAGAASKPGGDANFFPDGTPRVLRPNSMPDAPGLTMKDVEALRSARRRAEVLADPNDERRKPSADGFWTEEEDARAQRDFGIALRARRKGLAETIRAAEAVAPRAREARGEGVSVSGSVTNVIRTSDPKTRVESTVSGNLFQEMKTQRGTQMRKADD